MLKLMINYFLKNNIIQSYYYKFVCTDYWCIIFLGANFLFLIHKIEQQRCHESVFLIFQNVPLGIGAQGVNFAAWKTVLQTSVIGTQASVGGKTANSMVLIYGILHTVQSVR